MSGASMESEYGNGLMIQLGFQLLSLITNMNPLAHVPAVSFG